MINRHNSLLRRSLLGVAFLGASALPPSVMADRENPDYYSEIRKLDSADPEAELSELLGEGAILVGRRGDIVLLHIPAEPEDMPPYQATNSKRKRGYSRSRRPKIQPRPTMDAALNVSGVDRIITGRNLPQAYDGSGVVVGFCDIGLDTRHLNFLNNEGNCRISKVVKFVESEGRKEEYSDPAAIYEFHTDTAEETHATHVAGILAGSHEIRDDALILPPRASIAPAAPGIRGVASGADIVATMSELSEVGLLAGVEEIIAYAKDAGKPAVINMSVGNYNGPHDGTSLFCQYLDLCAEDAIIVLSSGNEGADTNHQRVPGATADNPLIARIAGCDWVNLVLYGQTDIYAADSTPFSLSIRITDSTRDGQEYTGHEIPVINLDKNQPVVISSRDLPGEEGWIYDEEFARHFNGEVYVEGGIDPENGRFRASVVYDCTTEEPYSDEKRWAKYRIELVARPEAPVLLDAFADGSYSWLANWRGNKYPPGNELSISDLACGEKTISVGMYCTGKSVIMANGTEHSGEFDTPCTVTNYSSYGLLYDGRRLPLTVGPGSPIVSSMSGAFITHDNSGSSHSIMDDEGIYHYWGPMTGTSMSSPFVAGTIATWLQADPTLTWKEVQEIVAETNYYPSFAPEGTDPHYGSGLFDGYAGLKKILGLNGITGVSGPSTGLSVNCADGRLNILNPSGADVTVEAYTLQGIKTYLQLFSDTHAAEIPLSRMKQSSEPLVVRISTTVDKPLILKVY